VRSPHLGDGNHLLPGKNRGRDNLLAPIFRVWDQYKSEESGGPLNRDSTMLPVKVPKTSRTNNPCLCHIPYQIKGDEVPFPHAVDNLSR